MKVRVVLDIGFDDAGIDEDHLGDDPQSGGAVPGLVSDAMEDLMDDAVSVDCFQDVGLPAPAAYQVAKVEVVAETERLVARLENTVKLLKEAGWTQADFAKALAKELSAMDEIIPLDEIQLPEDRS